VDSGSSANPDILDAGAMGSGTVYYVKWAMGITSENGGTGQQLSIHPGDSVVWVATDNMQHTTTSSSGTPKFDTGFFGPGQSKAIPFATAGTWNYECAIHGAASMQGTVKVQ
jgi:plastocyanin